MEANKQGIGSILGSDCESIRSPLRRTLSADMSSKKWQSQHSLKKVSSFVSIPHYSSSPSEEEPRGQFEIWSSIQEENKKKELESPGQLYIWSSILSQKDKEAENSTPNPVPYVHPLVRRSSSLSEKSLEICTESLGSETGSDGFSSYSASESSDVEDKKEVEEEESQEQEEKPYQMEAWRPVKYNTTPSPAASKKSSPKSCLSLLPSLSRGNGASLQMRPRRDNGRLVLEAVSIPSQNNFLAQRGDGRLVLTLANTCNQQDQQMNGNGMFEFDVDSCDNGEDQRTDMETEEEENVNQRESKDAEFVKEEAPINFHRVALMMNKPGLSLSNENSKWLNKFNEIGQVEETRTSVTQSLPPRPPVGRMIPAAKITASASALNAYEHYWKARPMSLTKDNNNKNNGDFLVPVSKGCQERRRSLLLWEPYCIATS